MLGVWDTSENADVTRRYIDPNHTAHEGASAGGPEEKKKLGKNAAKKAKAKMKKKK